MNENEVEKKLKQVWEEKSINPPDDKIDHSWDKFSSIAFSSPKKPIKYWIYAAAAVLVVSLSVSSFWLVNKNQSQGNTVAHNFTIIKNPSGLEKFIYLPDSSIVEMAPYSRLEYADNFIKNRMVYLYGEAYFKVQKDKRHPFQVYCQETTTTVLGTSFTIKEDSNNSISVKLYEGSVKMNVKDSTNNWLLAPGEKFIYNHQSLTVESFNRFKDFNKEPLTSVIEYIQTNYGYKLNLPSQFLNKQITIRISEKEELSNIIGIIAEIYNLDPHTNEPLKEINFK